MGRALLSMLRAGVAVAFVGAIAHAKEPMSLRLARGDAHERVCVALGSDLVSLRRDGSLCVAAVVTALL